MPSYPVMMMFADPFRMTFVPPTAVMPDVSFVIVTIVDAPLGVHRYPFGMVDVDPARMVVMPPVRVVPFMVLVPVAIVMVRISHHRRSREQGRQGRGGEKCSEFHFWYLLEREKW